MSKMEDILKEVDDFIATSGMDNAEIVKFLEDLSAEIDFRITTVEDDEDGSVEDEEDETVPTEE